MDWLVVRFGGERDGVKGQRGAWFVRPSSESSPLPLKFKVRRAHNVITARPIPICSSTFCDRDLHGSFCNCNFIFFTPEAIRYALLAHKCSHTAASKQAFNLSICPAETCQRKTKLQCPSLNSSLHSESSAVGVVEGEAGQLANTPQEITPLPWIQQ